MGTDTMENVMESPENAKIELSYDPAFPRLDIYPEGEKKKKRKT